MSSGLLFLLLSLSIDGMQSEHQYNPPIIHPLQIYFVVIAQYQINYGCRCCSWSSGKRLCSAISTQIFSLFVQLHQHQYTIYLLITQHPTFCSWRILAHSNSVLKSSLTIYRGIHVRDALLSKKCSFFEHCSKGL